MNRRGLIILFSLVIAILVIVLIWGITGSWAGFTSAVNMQGLERLAEFETSADKISGLELDFRSADIVIKPAAGDRITIVQDGFSALPDHEQMRCGVRGSTVVAGVPSATSPVSCMGNISQQSVVTIEVPAQARLTVKTNTLSGNVEIGDLELADCSADSLSGRFSIKNVHAQLVSLETASGDIEVTGMTCRQLDADSLSGRVFLEAETDGNISADTASGDIELRGNAQEVEMETASGSIGFRGSAQEVNTETASGQTTLEVEKAHSIRTEAMSGDIEIICPEAADLRSVRADTASGSVELDLPRDTALNLDFDSASGQLLTDSAGGLILGDGRGTEVRVSTASGNFRLVAL